jgi:hypothetical protein
MKYGYARVSSLSQARDGNSLEGQVVELKFEKRSVTDKIFTF